MINGQLTNFTPYEIDDSKDKKLTNIFGDEYIKEDYIMIMI